MSRKWLKLFRPHLETLEARLVPTQFYEAETAILSGISPYFDGGAINNYPRVEDVHTSGQTGYDGDGYVNLAYSDDSTITWDNVTEDQAGDYTVAFRYSMNTYYTNIFIPARPMGLRVNDNVITRALDFEATGDSTMGVDPWSIWDNLPITVHLNAGVNTIELFATDLAATGANPHLDSMTVTPVPAGVLPDAPTDLTASAGVGDVDLQWPPSAIASSYNIYRSTVSGGEQLVATGVTANYFFDTGLASDGTSYFYQVTAVNAAGESAGTQEVSATPSAPDGLVFSDDFSTGVSDVWTLTPEEDYWQPQVGRLTDAQGDTVANTPQTATAALPAGTVTWQADLLTKEGHGAAVDTQGNPGNSGIYVESTDNLNDVYFSVFDNYTLNFSTRINGVRGGWHQVGIAYPVQHRGGPELLQHTYQIRLDANGTFSVLFDGTVLSSNISAGPASAWADGIGSGTLFTLSPLDNRHLSTSFDNVRALGAGGAPHAPPTFLAPFAAAIVTNAGVNRVENPGPANEASGVTQTLISVPAVPAVTPPAGDNHARQSSSVHAATYNITRGIRTADPMMFVSAVGDIALPA
jgi:hypothetical protein